MKRYCYYPGCSSEATAKGLGLSIEAIAEPLEMELVEPQGWTCCGAVHYGSLDGLEAVAVAAYSLALAEATGLDMMTPCTGCFVTFNRAIGKMKEDAVLMRQVNQGLAAAGLEYKGDIRLRTFTEVLINDITPQLFASRIKRDLSGLKVAPYYGCQLVRPDFGFDDPEAPQKLDNLVKRLGAEAVLFPMKNRCCGSSLIIPEEDMALAFIHKVLKNADDNGAQCLVTPCPLCQVNLDAYQGRVNSRFKTSFRIPVLFISQLVGLALGLDKKALGLQTNIVSPKAVLKHIAARKEGVAGGA